MWGACSIHHAHHSRCFARPHRTRASGTHAKMKSEYRIIEIFLQRRRAVSRRMEPSSCTHILWEKTHFDSAKADVRSSKERPNEWREKAQEIANRGGAEGWRRMNKMEKRRKDIRDSNSVRTPASKKTKNQHERGKTAAKRSRTIATMKSLSTSAQSWDRRL